MLTFASDKRFGLSDYSQWHKTNTNSPQSRAPPSPLLSGVLSVFSAGALNVNWSLFVSQSLRRDNSLQTNFKRKKEIWDDGCVENFHYHDHWRMFSSKSPVILKTQSERRDATKNLLLAPITMWFSYRLRHEWAPGQLKVILGAMMFLATFVTTMYRRAVLEPLQAQT